MEFLDREDIENKLNKIEEGFVKEESLEKQRKINLGLRFLNLGLYGAGFFFLPLGIAGIGLHIGLNVHANKMEKNRNKLIEEMFQNTVDLTKYSYQMEFTKKMSKLIDGYYKESFKDKSFTKEEQLCQHIKLNTPEQMDSKLLGELKVQKKKII